MFLFKGVGFAGFAGGGGGEVFADETAEFGDRGVGDEIIGEHAFFAAGDDVVHGEDLEVTGDIGLS